MFVQVIEFRTNRIDDIRVLDEEWVAATEGERSATRNVIGRDRKDPDRYFVIVEFPSYEDAMRNSQLPATGEFARRMRELCSDGPVFVDLDVVDQRSL